ncbi:MAG: glutamate---cysteine ligase / carboxylate-amine ligase [Chloroflexota bacterium]|jgi:carboxylate-amine ligase|nr:glutamate---cysteine ligase / carboxylate-amine ligase [Chloroflexota bacterium]
MTIQFFPSERASVGVEMELELVDRETRELRSVATEILDEMGKGHPEGVHPTAKHELMESTVEILTGISATVADAERDLAATIVELREQTGKRGLELLCSGTHPFTDWATQAISPNPRYLKLIEDMEWMARRMQIFGVHVHVGVRAPEKAIPIVNAVTAYIPHFLALSASSPYWMGRDTGLASCRSKVFEGLPTAGPPYQLSGWDEFERFMGTLISARTIQTIREVWWDVRPHPNFGTVELRVCDGLPTLFEVGAITALFQSLVHRMDGQLDDGYALPMPREWIVRENKWRAARHGIDAEVITDEAGRTERLRDSISELVDELGPVARRLGCEEELARVNQMMERGPSYLRQREVVAAGGTLVDVVDSLVTELATNQFARRQEPLAGTAPGPQRPSVTPPSSDPSRVGE